ncbi:MAG TPA: Ni/Fe-hydrogenase, b-type cytochrome subunit [Gemmatimonadales bacterium]|nr:Ni/Fe-hydrogenase, b-type cytochrome subunit [Gemmatimonadales bacterium]
MTAPAAGAPARAPSKSGYRWVYLWHWPIRIMHWVAALAIVVLVVTGFYIGKPYFMTSGEASDHFLMGWVRFLHFAAAGVLVATGIIRVYWLFAGNRYERWTALFPVRPRDWVNTFLVIRKYLFIMPERTPHFLGHNPLQQLSYTGLYALVLFQVISGFALYGQADPGGLFATTFGWVAPLVGGMQRLRFLHHVVTWAFLIFLPVHVHFSVRADRLHKHPALPAIISGGRFVRDDLRFEDE